MVGDSRTSEALFVARTRTAFRDALGAGGLAKHGGERGRVSAVHCGGPGRGGSRSAHLGSL